MNLVDNNYKVKSRFFKIKKFPKALSIFKLADAWVSFVCELYKILKVRYPDRWLGKPVEGLWCPLRGRLKVAVCDLKNFVQARDKKCMVWTAPIKKIVKKIVELLISLPKCYFWIQTTLICLYHINLKEDAKQVFKTPSYYPSTVMRETLLVVYLYTFK